MRQVDYDEEFDPVMTCVIDMAMQYCDVEGVKENDPWCSTLEVGVCHIRARLSGPPGRVAGFLGAFVRFPRRRQYTTPTITTTTITTTTTTTWQLAKTLGMVVVCRVGVLIRTKRSTLAIRLEGASALLLRRVLRPSQPTFFVCVCGFRLLVHALHI